MKPIQSKHLFACCIIISALLYVNASINVNNKPEQREDPGNIVLNRIKDYIYKFAEERMKSLDLNIKRNQNGNLPEGYSEDIRRKAKQAREDKSRYNPIMKYPTELFTFCVYPFSKVSFVKWCNSKYFDGKNKKQACNYSMCQVCCDNLVYIYQGLVNNYIGNQLKLETEYGKEAIKSAIDISAIEKCKLSCQTQYPVEMPTPAYQTPRDPTLGLTKDNPGVSCADIHRWGG
jgi:hypothetical protein